jgi:hypothetical protein
MYDFDEEFAQTYTETCANCGDKIQVSTQQDRTPEYYTAVYVKCMCGDSVEFRLPVN